MTAATALSRRSALMLLGATAAASTVGQARQATASPLQRLAFYGPPAGPTITLAHAVAAEHFADIADEPSVQIWRNPDELRAGLTSGTIALSIVPVQAAANLYNRGFPIRLANVMTNGLLYVIARDPQIGSIADLAGRRVAVPFRGDTPEIIFQRLLAHHGLSGEGEVEILFSGSPIEAMQLALAGRVDAALTAEPSTTAGILRGRSAGVEVRRAIDIQAAWGEMTSAAAVLPQAGLAVTQAFLDDASSTLPAIQQALKEAATDVNAEPEVAAAHATDALRIPAPLLAASIPGSNLVARAAGEARSDIERMLGAMAGDGLDRIGGRLPDDGFYVG
ncbi:MAG: ABC transporter substrate-binding protein [Pseudomonadota bacterium]